MIVKVLLFFSLLSSIAVNTVGQGLISVSSISMDGMASPRGVDISNFRFSWILNSSERNQIQRAYEIKIFSDKTGKSLTWTSGIIKSSASINIVYNGKPLKSGTSYYWQVRVWNGSNAPSAWSDLGRFVTAFRDKDWGDAKWIAMETVPDSVKIVPGVHAPNVSTLGNKGTKRYSVPYFRKDFNVGKKIQEALVFVSGMGHYELSMNGNKVHDSFLAPGWTNYAKRSLYNIYDVTDQLVVGRNAIGLIVGNGFFNINRERYFKLVSNYGSPQAICKLQIKYEDGSTESIVSNNEWKACPSPTTFSSIYGGEDYDARLEQNSWDAPLFNDNAWQNAIEVKNVKRMLSPERTHPVKIMESIPTHKIQKLFNATFLYDFGQNASGLIHLKVKGKKGQVVKISPAELIEGNEIRQGASGEPFYFTYTLKGDGVEEWSPKFTYYGFRFVKIEGAVPASEVGIQDTYPVIVDIVLKHNRNSAPSVGSFQCSNQLFNQINELILWAVKSNMQSTLTDCPHREKLGWLEQDYLMGDAMQFNFDVFSLYRKITDDMIDAQQADGLVPDIAPEFVVFEDGFRDSPEWGSSSVILPWLVYKNYGDDKILHDAYPMMKRYVKYLQGKSRNNLLSHGLGDWFDYGPKQPGEAQLTPKTLTATAIYYYDLTLLKQIAEILGEKNDAKYYDNLANDVKTSFNSEFFDEKTKLYSTGSQAALAMPLCLGLVDKTFKQDVVNKLVASIQQSNNALTAGDIGFHFLIRALSENNQSQVIFDMNARSDVPGYGFQLAKGATALTESWPALTNVSNNHLMLGHIMEWFYNGILGINQDEKSLAYKSLVIKPQFVGDIQWAKGDFLCPYGNVKCDWKRNENNLFIDVEIPVNTSAQIVLPAKTRASVLLDGRPIHPGSKTKVSFNDVTAILSVGSGRYSFSIKNSE